MSNKSLRVLVYGATGSQMGPVPYKLLEKGHQPYVLTRGGEKAEALRQAGAHVVIGDVNDYESLVRASQGMDAVALMIPAFVPNPMEVPGYLKSAFEAAKAAGVKLVVWNTSGPIIPQRTGNPMYDMRLDMVEIVKSSGVPAIVIQPTLYMENLLGPWTRSFVIEKDLLAYPTPKDMPLGWVATEDVASLIVAALERPELAGSHFIASGEENLTGPELAERFSRGLGRRVDYYPMPLEEFGAFMERMFGPGTGEAAIMGYRFQIENNEIIPTWTDMRPMLEKLPVQMTSVEAWARKFQRAFQKEQVAAP